MNIHIGNNIYLDEKDIIAILNKKTIDESEINFDYINCLIGNGCLKNEVDNIRTYIVTKQRNKGTEKDHNDLLNLYVSKISSNSLLKRHKELDRREANE